MISWVSALAFLTLVLAVYGLIFLWTTYAPRNPTGQPPEPIIQDPEADQ